MASLRFHKVSSLPASCTLGDVYYVVGEGIYVCTTAASSGATEAANYTRFSYANDAASGVKGVTSLSDSVSTTSSAIAATSTAVKTAYDRGSKGISDAADVQTNLTSHTNNKNNPHGVTKGQVGLGNVTNNAQVKGLATGTKSGNFVAWGADGYTVADSGKNAKSFDAAGTAATEAGKVLGKSGDSASAATVYGVITKANALASRISSLEGKAATGMQYKGTTAAVPSSGKVGDVYKVTTAISTLGAEVGDFIVCRTATDGSTAATWDVWQANVTKDAYWDQNTPISGQIVVADGADGKIKTSGYNVGSFATASHKQASDTINAMTGYSKPTSASAIAVGDTLNAAIGKLECKVDTTQTSLSKHTSNTGNPHNVTASQVGLGNVTNNRQVVGLSDGTTAGHFVTWGADGYTVADSGKSASSFDAAGTASGLINTLRGGYTDTLQSVANAAANAQSTANSKWAAVDASSTDKGIMKVGTGLSASSGTVSVVYGATAGTACQGNDSRLSDARTPVAHNQASNTITKMTGYSKPSSASAIAASDSLNAAIGKLEYKADDAISKANSKWAAVDATTSSKGIASFNSSNFAVSNGAVSLAWAEFV